MEEEEEIPSRPPRSEHLHTCPLDPDPPWPRKQIRPLLPSLDNTPEFHTPLAPSPKSLQAPI